MATSDIWVHIVIGYRCIPIAAMHAYTYTVICNTYVNTDTMVPWGSDYVKFKCRSFKNYQHKLFYWNILFSLWFTKGVAIIPKLNNAGHMWDMKTKWVVGQGTNIYVSLFSIWPPRCCSRLSKRNAMPAKIENCSALFHLILSGKLKIFPQTHCSTLLHSRYWIPVGIQNWKCGSFSAYATWSGSYSHYPGASSRSV